MPRIHVERLTLERLRAAGFADPTIAWMLHRAGASTYHRPATARRVLERALGSTITIGASPSVHRLTPTADATRDGAMVAVATIDLGGHLGWRGGDLLDPLGTVPRTVAAAAPGRRVGELIAHPHIDPDLVMRAPRADMPHAAVTVDASLVTLPVPTFPGGRPAAWRAMMRLRRAEKDTGAKMPEKTFAIAAFVMACVISSLIARTPKDFDDVSALIAVIGALVIVLTIIADFRLGHLLVEAWPGRDMSTYEVLARERHGAEMERLRKERGFTDDGTSTR